MQDKLELEKFVVFRIAEYYLALPIDNILRVIKHSPQREGKLNEIGLTQIGRHTIKILDLHQSLGCDRPSLESSAFLIITHDYKGQPYGIPVYTPPDLVEMPLRLMQGLPPHNHPSNILSIASHAAVISQDDATTTVFLLDFQRAKDLWQVEKQNDSTTAKMRLLGPEL